MNREVVRELVCAKLNIEDATAELRSILKGGAKREQMIADFETLRDLIGSDGASQRFATDIVNILKR